MFFKLELGSIRDRKKIFRNFFLILRPKPSYAPGPQESIALWSDTKFERLSPFRSFFPISPQWDYIWTIIEKSSEKDLNVRISLRTKAQSIPEGLGHNLALGAKIKNNYEKFFYDPLIGIHSPARL